MDASIDILRSMSEAVVATELGGTIVLWNPSAEKLYGWRSEEVLGRNILEIAPAPHSAEEAATIMSELRAGRTWSGSFPLRRRDHSTFTAKVIDAPWFDASGELAGVVGISCEQPRQEEEAPDADVLAGLVHELRSPLAPILFSLDLLQHELRDPLLADSVSELREILGGRAPLHMRPLSLASVARTALETFRRHAEPRSRDIEVHLTEPMPVEGDFERLVQCVVNVIDNALKYSGTDGRVEVAGRRLGGDVELSVSDDGIGMTAEILASAFELFRRSPAPQVRDRPGLGVGLSLCRRIVELHGGSIRISSDGEEQGSQVVLRLPAARDR